MTEEELGINPSVGPLQIPVYELTSKLEFVKGPYGKMEQKSILLESTPKTTLYITSAHRKLMSSLPTASKELLLWLLYELDSNKHSIWINKSFYMKECGIAINTYKKALDGLIRLTYLTPTAVSNVYWINPALFFRGNRVNKYPDKLIFSNNSEEVIQENIDNNI
jgi:hypothetical protein